MGRGEKWGRNGEQEPHCSQREMLTFYPIVGNYGYWKHTARFATLKDKKIL